MQMYRNKKKPVCAVCVSNDPNTAPTEIPESQILSLLKINPDNVNVYHRIKHNLKPWYQNIPDKKTLPQTENTESNNNNSDSNNKQSVFECMVCRKDSKMQDLFEIKECKHKICNMDAKVSVRTQFLMLEFFLFIFFLDFLGCVFFLTLNFLFICLICFC